MHHRTVAQTHKNTQHTGVETARSGGVQAAQFGA
jgi:hypothetical protein